MSALIFGVARHALPVIGIWLSGAPSVQAQDTPAFRETGTASFYAAEMAGRRTASGERYDPEAMTAAHPTLPLGAEVTVVAVATGRQVVVVINDRGPFTGGRRYRSWLRSWTKPTCRGAQAEDARHAIRTDRSVGQGEPRRRIPVRRATPGRSDVRDDQTSCPAASAPPAAAWSGAAGRTMAGARARAVTAPACSAEQAGGEHGDRCDHERLRRTKAPEQLGRQDGRPASGRPREQQRHQDCPAR